MSSFKLKVSISFYVVLSYIYVILLLWEYQVFDKFHLKLYLNFFFGVWVATNLSAWWSKKLVLTISILLIYEDMFYGPACGVSWRMTREHYKECVSHFMGMEGALYICKLILLHFFLHMGYSWLCA